MPHSTRAMHHVVHPYRSTVVLAAATLSAWAGEPQCPPNFGSCVFNVNNGFFGNPYDKLTRGDPLTHEDKDELCRSSHWRDFETCYDQCPLSLVVTSPPHRAMTLCVRDSQFVPFVPASHIDLHHPLNAKELNIMVLPPSTAERNTRTGCLQSFYNDGRNYTGALVVVQRGGCRFDDKAKNAFAAGASALLVSNIRTENSMEVGMMSMSGWSTGFEGMPAVFAPKQLGDLLLEGSDAGDALSGHLVLDCTRGSGGAGASLNDGCPRAALAAACEHVADPVEAAALCRKCPLALRFAGTSRDVCLYGNKLFPRDPATYLQTSLTALPQPVTPDIVYASGGCGCTAEDWAGLRGKLVVLPPPLICTTYGALRRAAAAGVRAVIILTPPNVVEPAMIEGLSTMARMPAHATAPGDYDLLARVVEQAMAAADGRRVVSLGLATLKEGAWRAGTNETVGKSVEEERLVMDSNGGADTLVIAMLILCGVLLLVLLAICVRLHQQRGRPDFEGDPAVREGLLMTIPLNAANMGLSITLLVAVGGIAFGLMNRAGQTGLNSTADDGRAATKSAYLHAQESIEELSDQLLESASSSVAVGLRTALHEGEEVAEMVALLYMSYDGTWASFDAITQTLVRVFQERHYIPVVYTNKGFYASTQLKTDDRPDSLRNDGVVGPVSVTNNGFLYYIAIYTYNALTLTSDFLSANAMSVFNVRSGTYGDPLATTAALPRGYMLWELDEILFLTMNYVRFIIRDPVSVFTPLVNEAGQVVGTVEARTSVTSFSHVVSDAVLATGSASNVSLVVFNAETGRIVGSNAWPSTTRIIGTHERNAFEATYMLEDFPPEHVHAYSRFRQKNRHLFKADGSYSGVFDQQEYYAQQNFVVACIAVRNGTVADLCAEQFEVSVRDGGCGDCVAYDSARGRDVLQLDGRSVLYLDMNLTTETPRVAATRLGTGDDPWASSNSIYTDTKVIDPARNLSCVAVEVVHGVKPCLLREGIFTLRTFSIRVNPDEVIDHPSPNKNTPVLLSDTVGDGGAMVRLYSTGALYVLTMEYGCRTARVVGGLPAGVWTTVSLVLNVTYSKNPQSFTGSTLGVLLQDGTCTVYINGTEHSSGAMARGMTLLSAREPFVVARHFRGRIDDVLLYNTSMSAGEVRHLHERGHFKRDVPSRQWFVRESRLDLNGPLSSGSHWGVLALLPRDDVMSSVDRNNKKTLAELDRLRVNASDNLSDMTKRTGAVLTAVALTAIILFTVFNALLTRPIEELAFILHNASFLKVQAVPDSVSASRISEVAVAARAAARLVDNLTQYKSFLPMQVKESAQQAIEGFTPGGASTTDPCVQPPGDGVTDPVASIVFTDIRGSTALWERSSSMMGEGMKVHNAIIRQCICRHCGYEVKTIGDSFMVAFERFVEAVRFGLDVQKALHEAVWPEALVRAGAGGGTGALHHCDGWPGLRVRIGANCGPVSIEYNAITERVDYFGATVNRAARLERASRPGDVTVLEGVLSQEALLSKLGNVSCEAVGMHELKGLPGRYMLMGLRHSTLAKLTPRDEPASGFNPLSPSSRLPSCGGATPSAHEIHSATSCSSFDTDTTGGNSMHSGSGSAGARKMTRESAALQLADEIVKAKRSVVVMDLRPTVDHDWQALRHLFQSVAMCLRRTDGGIVSVQGARIFAGWGLLSKTRNHAAQAINFAGLIQTSLPNETTPCGISSGSVSGCYVGDAESRFVTYGGTCVDVCVRVCDLARKLQAGVLYSAVTDRVDTSATGSAYMRPLLRLTDARNIVVYQILGNAGRTIVADPGEDSEEAKTWGWTQAYIDLFAAGRLSEILERAKLVEDYVLVHACAWMLKKQATLEERKAQVVEPKIALSDNI